MKLDHRLPLLTPALLLWAVLAPAAPAHAQQSPALLEPSRQLLVVTTAHWDSTAGVLQRFARADAAAEWRPVGSAVPVVLGRSGLAWGAGFDAYATAGAPRKQEGDGRSPAGAFALGTAFGFAPADSVPGVRLPYLPLGAGTECVDDTASVHYNALVDRGAVPQVDWGSSERMRQIGVYRLGVVVDYNGAPAARGRGSCIFLHSWKGPASTTAGCTAMADTTLQQVVEWLRPEARPALVQLPRAAYVAVQQPWRLPPLPPR